VLELLDRDLCVRSRLLLRLDDLVQVAQLGVEPRQRRALLLKTTLSLAMLDLSCGLDQMSRKSFVSWDSAECITHLTLGNFVHERFELLAHLVNSCRRICEGLARRSDICLDLF